MTKTERQEKGVEIWYPEKDGIFGYITGFGKTNTAIKAIEKIEQNKKGIHLIVVPNEGILSNWKEYIPKNLLNRIILKTVEKLLNENLSYEVLSLTIDEVHDYHTEDKLTLINKTLIKYEYFIGLTASIYDKNFYKIKRLHKVVDIITYEEAVENNWIDLTKEYNIPLALNKVEEITYIDFCKVIDGLFPKFKIDLDLLNKIVYGGKDKRGIFYSGAGYARSLALANNWRTDLDLRFRNFQEIDNIWNPNKLIKEAGRLLAVFRLRKNLLDNAESKKEATLKILQHFKNISTILFSNSTQYADDITTLLNKNNIKTVVYHSNLKPVMKANSRGKLIKYGKVRLQREAIEAITTKRATVISTGSSLDKGIDIPILKLGIVSSGTSNPTQEQQRRGRITRILEDDNAMFINLYIKGTQDEKWLNSRKVKNDNHIYLDKLEDLFNPLLNNQEKGINETDL